MTRDQVIENLDVCDHCDGTGLVEIPEHVTGDNIMPGGFYEGSGMFKKCECRLED